MNLEKHPLQLLLKIAKKYAKSGETPPVFTATSYRRNISSYGVEDQDVEVRTFLADRLKEDLPKFMADAHDDGLDVVINSTVTIDGEEWHIPMVDFSVDTKKWKPYPSLFEAFSHSGGGPLSCLQPISQWAAFEPNDLVFYTSGRSYHAYGTVLMTDREWLDFMGALLLVNIPGDTEMVDTRWVGRRLLARSGALRLTKTNDHYLAEPELVGNLPPSPVTPF